VHHGDEQGGNARGGLNQRFNSRGLGGNQYREGYGKNYGPGGGEGSSTGANPNPRYGGAGYKRSMDERVGQGIRERLI
jgi:hypothetical protein